MIFNISDKTFTVIVAVINELVAVITWDPRLVK